METKAEKLSTVDQYIAGFSEEIRRLIQQMRSTVRQAAPEAEEVLSYQMPAYKYHGIVVYFAAHKHHIGFYPLTSAMNAFSMELSAYVTSKGTVQFPYDKPLPLDLIARMVAFRMIENRDKAALKKKKSK
ncbi:MAG: DUF1801 domain-containing protein [Bacteroidetes bacterium]|nr:DUF1801 domain-containing protein [Bacteroidota bacterium]